MTHRRHMHRGSGSSQIGPDPVLSSAGAASLHKTREQRMVDEVLRLVETSHQVCVSNPQGLRVCGFLTPVMRAADLHRPDAFLKELTVLVREKCTHEIFHLFQGILDSDFGLEADGAVKLWREHVQAGRIRFMTVPEGILALPCILTQMTGEVQQKMQLALVNDVKKNDRELVMIPIDPETSFATQWIRAYFRQKAAYSLEDSCKIFEDMLASNRLI